MGLPWDTVAAAVGVRAAVADSFGLLGNACGS